MLIEINSEQRDYIHTHILPKLSDIEMLDLIQHLKRIWLDGNEDVSSPSEITMRISSAASDIERGLKKLEELIAERGSAYRTIGDLDYHFDYANGHELSMVKLSISAGEVSGTVHSLRKIANAIRHQADELNSQRKHGRPPATKYQHSLRLIMYWFDFEQPHYKPSATQESPFVVFVTYLFTDVLKLSINDPRRHIANALKHHKATFGKP